MLLNSHISAYARCLAGKVCSLVRSTWGTSQGEDKPTVTPVTGVVLLFCFVTAVCYSPITELFIL